MKKDGKTRTAIAEAFGQSAHEHGYTLWARAICSNHAHVVARTHRDRSETIWHHLALEALLALRELNQVPSNHPVWSDRPYKAFLYSPADVIGRIDYVNDNSEKEGHPRQNWSFVQEYPHQKR